MQIKDGGGGLITHLLHSRALHKWKILFEMVQDGVLVIGIM